jgi:hypothetical protein
MPRFDQWFVSVLVPYIKRLLIVIIFVYKMSLSVIEVIFLFKNEGRLSSRIQGVILLKASRLFI